MSLPPPQPGLVIRYSYLWRSEAEQGREEGVKDRPCAVVLTSKREGDKLIVVVAPITHSPPLDPQCAIEIPAAVKARLHLDQEKSWIITDDLNFFTWPGSDIRPINPREKPSRFSYGYLPEKMTWSLINNVRELMQTGRAKPVRRDE